MKLKITVHGVAYEVEVEVLDPGEGFAPPSALPQVTPRASASPTPAPLRALRRPRNRRPRARRPATAAAAR